MAESMSQGQALNRSAERPAGSANGYGMLLVALAAIVVGVFGASRLAADPALGGTLIAVGVVAFLFVICGFYMLQPNQAVAITLFGSYKGTDRSAALRWASSRASFPGRGATSTKATRTRPWRRSSPRDPKRGSIPKSCAARSTP